MFSFLVCGRYGLRFGPLSSVLKQHSPETVQPFAQWSLGTEHHSLGRVQSGNSTVWEQRSLGTVQYMDVNGNPTGSVEETLNANFNQSDAPAQVTERGDASETRMTKDEPDSDLPSKDQAKDFYALYEPRDILGK